MGVLCLVASASAAVTSRAKVDKSSLDALVGGNDVRCDLDHREARLDHLPCDQLDSLVACDTTDPVFTPGEERSAEDVPLFCVVLPLPADPHPAPRLDQGAGQAPLKSGTVKSGSARRGPRPAPP